MEKALLSITRRSVSSLVGSSIESFKFSTSSNKSSKVLADRNGSTSRKYNNVFERAIENGLRQCPSTKVFGFYNKPTFQTFLSHYSLASAGKAGTTLAPSFTLSRNVLLELLPQNCHVGVFSHKQLLQVSKAVKNPQNIYLNNLFKDQETLDLAKALGVTQMVVNSPDELQKLYQLNTPLNYIWEFESIDPDYVGSLLAMLAKYNVPLYGLKFNSELAADNRALVSNVCKAIQKSLSFSNSLRKVIIDTPLSDLEDLQTAIQDSELSSFSGVSQTVEINDLNTNNFVRCATRVIGKKSHGYVFNPEAEQFLSQEQLLGLNSQYYNVGDWVSFRPVNCGLLNSEKSPGVASLVHVDSWIG